MNTLTWFLYLADVLGGVAILCALAGILSLIMGAIGWFGSTVVSGMRAAALPRYGEGHKEVIECDEWLRL